MDSTSTRFMLGIGRFSGCAVHTAPATPTLDIRLSEMPWETSLLGRKIGRVEGLDGITDLPGGAEALYRVEQEAISAAFSVLTARVTADRFAAIWALEASGFLTVDHGITFEYDLTKNPRSFGDHTAGDLTVRAATDDDVPTLQEMVGGLFRNSYYYVSPFFSSAEADLLHRTWITNCVRHARADRVLLAEVSGATAGFITCRRLPDGVGVIDLVGVAPRHGSRGIGKALVGAGLGCFHELAAAIVRVRTQLTNAAAVKLYSATGARLVKVDTTLIKSLAAARRHNDAAHTA